MDINDYEIIKQCLSCSGMCDELVNCPIKIQHNESPQLLFVPYSLKSRKEPNYLPGFDDSNVVKTLASLKALVSWIEAQTPQ